jgi:hypothetical protein
MYEYCNVYENVASFKYCTFCIWDRKPLGSREHNVLYYKIFIHSYKKFLVT